MEKKKKALELEAPKKTAVKKTQNAKKTVGAKQKTHEEAPEKNKKSTKKLNASNEKKERVQVFEESPRAKKLIHQIMPYTLMIVAVFVVICFLLIDVFEGVSSENGVGIVGKGIRDLLCGLFGFGAFFVPLFLAILSITWGYAVEKNCLLAKIFYALAAVVSVSALMHVIYVTVGEPYGITAGFSRFYQSGVALKSGGMVGGFVGEVLRTGVGLWGSVICTVALAIFFVIFLLGFTPGYVVTLVRYRVKIRREQRAAQNAERRAAEELAKEEERQAREEERKRRKEEQEREKKERLAEVARKREEEAERNRLERERREAETEPIVIIADGNNGLADSNESAPAEQEPIILVPPVNENDTVSESKNEDIIKLQPENTEVAESVKEPEIVEQPEPPKKSETEDMNQMLKEVFGDAPNTKTNKPDEKTDGTQKAANEETNPDAALLSAMREIDDLESMDDIVDDDDIEEITVEPEPAEYVFPPISLLAEDTSVKADDISEELNRNAKNLMDTLRSFNIKIKEIGYSRGPTITRYELKPEAGQRVRQIANLVDDIALNLATTGVRIEAPIPGKPAVGIEVPNENPSTVYLRSLIETEKFESESSKLTACLGADVGGKSVYFNIAKMPHLLIAGATGMGKSVCINSIIVSLLYKARPDEVKLILIDPKKVEFNSYKDIPHLYCPIVSDPAKAAGALASAVAEMERRFALIEEVGVRNIFNYNEVTKDDPTKEFMPQMVIIIDELADLMMTAKDAVESSICRLAQKARAAGIHIIIGTQRPSVDVITGLIKANIPSRIACTVTSQVDSRTIIDIGGAERLIGKGDMLFAPVGSSKPMRVQGAFVSEFEVEKIVAFIKENNTGAKYNEDFVKLIEEEAAKCTSGKKGAAGNATPMGDGDVEGGLDPKFKDAVELAIDSGKVSTSLLQRRLEIGYGRAAKIIDQMEEMGYVSAPDGNKPRKILISKEDFMQLAINDDI